MQTLNYIAFVIIVRLPLECQVKGQTTTPIPPSFGSSAAASYCAMVAYGRSFMLDD